MHIVLNDITALVWDKLSFYFYDPGNKNKTKVILEQTELEFWEQIK